MDEKERQYQEYLALRQHEQEKEMEKEYFSQPDDKYGQAFPDESKVRHSRRISVTETPYGSSEMRRAQKEKQRRDREMQEYLAAREADRDSARTRARARAISFFMVGSPLFFIISEIIVSEFRLSGSPESNKLL